MEKSVIYIGCYSDERTDNGDPKFKVEKVFNIELGFKESLNMLRGIEIFIDLLLNKTVEKEKSDFGKVKTILMDML